MDEGKQYRQGDELEDDDVKETHKNGEHKAMSGDRVGPVTRLLLVLVHLVPMQDIAASSPV